jgi:hypothetical protein
VPATARPLSAQSAFAADEVVAQFVYRVAQFVEWPSTALEGRDRVELCVAEPDPFGGRLDALVDRDDSGARRMAVRRVGEPRALEGCHLLYLSSAASRGDALLRAAEALPILTVGESSGFLDAGGVMRIIVRGRLQFEVNARALASSGLRLSSQLLALATRVQGSTP